MAGEIEIADEPIVEEPEIEPVITEEPSDEILESDLNKVNTDKADVSFLQAQDGDGTWKPTKKVLNIYNKTE